jgi:hypothetical protein
VCNPTEADPPFAMFEEPGLSLPNGWVPRTTVSADLAFVNVGLPSGRIPYKSPPGPLGAPHSLHSFSQFHNPAVTPIGNLNPS